METDELLTPVPIIYLSGPMSGYPEYNYPAFEEAQRELEAKGHSVLNPVNSGGGPEFTWAENMRLALKMLLEANTIVLLPGWRGSPGAEMEERIARSLGFGRYSLRYFLTRF